LRKRLGIAFSTRPRLAILDIDVNVDRGIVTLKGEVPTIYDRRLVTAITRHVAGVFRVEDGLVVIELDPRKSGLVATSEPSLPAHRQLTFRSRLLGERRRSAILRRSFAMIAMAALVFAGCGHGDAARVPVHPVQGAIQFRGQPIVGAFVSLHPKKGATAEIPTPRATVGPGGQFAVTTYDGQDGAPEGEYVLTVQWYKPIRQGDEVVGGPNVLPVKYARAQTSDVIVKVAVGDNRLQLIQLR
jgi:hypothetical protein